MDDNLGYLIYFYLGNFILRIRKYAEVFVQLFNIVGTTHVWWLTNSNYNSTTITNTKPGPPLWIIIQQNIRQKTVNNNPAPIIQSEIHRTEWVVQYKYTGCGYWVTAYWISPSQYSHSENESGKPDKRSTNNSLPPRSKKNEAWSYLWSLLTQYKNRFVLSKRRKDDVLYMMFRTIFIHY